MAKNSVYKAALGIEIGDIVGSSLVVNHITGPRFFDERWDAVVVWPWPIVSLRLLRPGCDHPRDFDYQYINDIRRAEDGRYLDYSDREIHITKPKDRPPLQVGMFTASEAEPYLYQDGVDYLAGDGHLWRCETCGADFNTEESHGLEDRRDIEHRCIGMLDPYLSIKPIISMWWIHPEYGRNEFLRKQNWNTYRYGGKNKKRIEKGLCWDRDLEAMME